jgi:PAS domain-containing protein
MYRTSPGDWEHGDFGVAGWPAPADRVSCAARTSLLAGRAAFLCREPWRRGVTRNAPIAPRGYAEGYLLSDARTTSIGGEPSTPRAAGQNPLEIILLRQWASYMAIPIWITSVDGMLIYFNEPAERIIGVRYGEAGPLPVGELVARFKISDEYGQPIRQRDLPLAVAIEQRKPSHSRLRIESEDGKHRVIAVTAFPIEGQGGRFLGAVAMFWEDDQS